MSRRSTKKLQTYLNELESVIHQKDVVAKSVSAVNVGWQIDHSLMVLNAVSGVLKSSNPEEFERKFKLSKSYIFAVGRIPRGRGRAPKSVQPTSEASIQQLQEQLETARKNISDLSTLDTQKFFKHPMFGNLRLKDSIRFLELHTIHHLRIIRSILKTK